MRHLEEFLRNYPYISEDIRRWQYELDRIVKMKNEMLDTLKAIAPTGMPPSGQESDPTFEAVQQIVDKYQKEIERIVKKITTLFDDEMTIKTLLAQLTRDERYVIEARYFQRPTVPWSKIARELHYHRVTCNDIRIRALKKMAKIKTPA